MGNREQNNLFPILFQTNLAKFASEVESGERSLNFFQYHLHFRDVFESKGGFDVVIGNPPYVRIQELDQELAKVLKSQYETAFKNYDLYILFIEKALKDLIKQNGYTCLINPTKFVKSGYGEKLKQFIYQNKLGSSLLGMVR